MRPLFTRCRRARLRVPREVLAWAARLTEPDTVGEQAIAGLRRLPPPTMTTAGRPRCMCCSTLPPTARTSDAAVAAFAGLPARIVPAVALGLHARQASARLAAVRALARMRQPPASDALMRALADADASRARSRGRGLRPVGHPRGCVRGGRLSEADPDEGVRRRAAIVCARFGWGRPR